MPNSIKYNTSSESNALTSGDFHIGVGDVDKGPTSTTGYWNGYTPPSGGYTIYLNKASNGPSIYAPSNDSELILLTNSIAGESFASAAECLNWYNTQNDKTVVNRDYETIVTDGLVFIVDAGFTPSYSTSGTTLYDLSGNGVEGTLTNGPTFDSGNGGSIVFDGTDDYVDYNSFGVGGDSSSYTFSAWSKNSNNSSILVRGRDGNGAGWSLRIGTSSNQFIASAAKSNPVVGYNVFGGAYVSSVWAYVTGVWESDTGKLSLYVNGSLEGSYTFSGTAPFALRSSTIGWSMAKITNSSIGQGSIACASVYNRALSPTEVLQNYNAQKGRFGL